MTPIKLLYVCSFSNSHARTYIQYFASRPDFDVTVISSDKAAEMPGVRLVSLDGGSGARDAAMKGRVSGLIFRLVASFPKLLRWIRAQEDMRQARKAMPVLREHLASVDCDVLHALRVQPEGLLGAEIARARPKVPYFLTVWGQDFIIYKDVASMRKMCAEAVREVDFLLPDNPRDERLARQEYALPGPSRSHVMAATGGLDFDAMERGEVPPERRPKLKGKINLLTARGYENSYVRIRVLVEAFAKIATRLPEVHLYIDFGRTLANPARDALHQKWVDDLGLSDRITILHLDRAELFGYMQTADIYTSATVTDGLPISLLECLYYGQAAVVMNHESTRAFLQGTADTFTYEAIEPQAIADAWTKAIENLGDRSQRTETNRQLLRRDNDRSKNLDVVASFYRDFYKEAL